MIFDRLRISADVEVEQPIVIFQGLRIYARGCVCYCYCLKNEAQRLVDNRGSGIGVNANLACQ